VVIKTDLKVRAKYQHFDSLHNRTVVGTSYANDCALLPSLELLREADGNLSAVAKVV